MKTVYRWRTQHAAGGVSAQVVGETLERIKSMGKLTPKNVVEEARAKESPIHKCFEWNDGRAAERYREHQARMLIGSIEVVVKTRTSPAAPVRAFVNVRNKGVREYTPIAVAMNNKEMREQLLQRALHDLVSWRERYHTLKELAAVVAAADLVLDRYLPKTEKKAPAVQEKLPLRKALAKSA
jgi:hypothetical protein